MLKRIIITIAVLCVPHSALAEGLFGSVEFKAPSIKAIPKWVKVLEKLEKEVTRFEACDEDIGKCDSPSLIAWRAFIKSQDKEMPALERIREVNIFANQWAYISDYENWGVSDYWATPSEFLRKSGDCEDYAILKYVTLKEMGFSPSQLRLVVVEDSIRQIAHAVLAVYPESKDDKPVILDSLFNAVLSHDQLMQYIPYYSVNETTRWAHIMPKNKDEK